LMTGLCIFGATDGTVPGSVTYCKAFGN